MAFNRVEFNYCKQFYTHIYAKGEDLPIVIHIYSIISYKLMASVVIQFVLINYFKDYLNAADFRSNFYYT